MKNFKEQFDIPLTEVIGRKSHITAFGREIAAAAEKMGIKGLVVPADNAKEAAVVKGVQVYGFRHLSEVVNFLNEPH